MTRISTGKTLLTLTSLVTAYGSYFFDWNETHIYNPNWPPHAKFHNAQTMSMGTAVGMAGLYTLWGRRGPWTRDRLQVSTAAASVYWITQLSSTLFPGTALFDGPWPASALDRADAGASGPGSGREQEEQVPARPPRVRGPQTVVASVSLALNVLAYGLESRRLARGSE
ncbi:DUF6640 family protein [Streptomyces sp. NPDC001093]|uniref:DUF6640 family protein n=1 Tax=Streptomyces sp. NPDC001093 TaxID=3154376 RepID=UPI0033276E28